MQARNGRSANHELIVRLSARVAALPPGTRYLDEPFRGLRRTDAVRSSHPVTARNWRVAAEPVIRRAG